MADDRLDKILERLERLERRIDQIEGRRPTGEVTPPPVVIRPVMKPRDTVTTEPVGGSWQRLHDISQRQPEKEPTPQTPKEDGEFVFGSKVLPRAGMVIVLLAMLYLVALGIQDGWITFKTQFVGELLLCAGLIGVGIWKLNEREDFGQVLVGGGSCGLYFSFAGAYAYKDLITSDALVVLFVLLSIVNLGFSWWRSSKTFWMIGFVGGLVAAAMPIIEQNYTTALALSATIVVAASVLAGYKLWFKALAGLWFVSGAFVIAVVTNAVDTGAMGVPGAIAVFYFIAVVPIAAHALRFVPGKFDDKGWFLLIAGGLTSVATLVIVQDYDVLPVPHSVAILFWSAALLALAGAVRGRVQSQTLLLTAVGTATVVAPMGFTALAACLTYAGLGLAATALARTWKREGVERTAAMFSAGFVVLTIAGYAVAMSAGNVASSTELAMLAAVAVGLANVAVVAGRLEKNMAGAMTIGAALLYPVLVRSVYVAADTEPLYAVLLAQSAYAIVLSVVALRARWQGLGVVGMFVSAAGAAIYWSLAVEPGHAIVTERLILALAVMTVGLAACSIGAGRDKTEKQIATVIGAILGTVIVVPMFGLVLRLPSVGMGEDAALVASLAIYAAVLAAISLRAKWQGYAIVAWPVTLAATVTYWFQIVVGPTSVSVGEQILLMSLVGASLALAALGSGSNRAELQTAAVLASIAGWFVVARLMYLVLVLPAVGMQHQAALTASWSVYAAAVLTLGFAWDFKNLRITSLIMFGVTIAKVFLVDLAELEDLVKVLVLLVLGLVILGGGYLYVRARNVRADAA